MPFTSQAQHYDKAPIREAIVDIQVVLPDATSVARLDSAAMRGAGYSEIRKLFRGHLTSQIDAGKLIAQTASDQYGYQFLDGKERKHIAQFRVDGFTFSRLSPYIRWKQLKEKAMEAWSIYRQVVPEAPAHRIALRYVNQIDLPAKLRDFKDYLRTYPEVSSDLPQSLIGFFSQIQIPLLEDGTLLNLTQAIVPPPSPSQVSVVLDVDVFRPNVKFASDVELWHAFESLRVQKNLVFESCITNRTRELIS